MRRFLTIAAVVGAAAVGALAMSDLLAEPELPARRSAVTTTAPAAPTTPSTTPPTAPAPTTATTTAGDGPDEGADGGAPGETTTTGLDPEHDTGVPLDEGELDGDFGG